ncbi:restriction endonuclease subunit S [Marinobacter sp.]|uniref:restriction endonuclease subunit S n=1 Tax=Marinobacter sp. TaxID=50741 RepID=UPI001B4CD41E|nr:restriction endonuclease subunit S [Marinobacter sp.]MBQ0832013.1 restriction endonuclease subunit S [Marinobacter sp.]
MYENQVRLGELITILSGFPFDSHRFTDAPGQPLIRIRDLLSNELKTFYSGPFDERYLVDNGEILVGMDGDFNVIRWTKGPALLNQRVCLIKPKTAKLDKSFLFWLLGPEIDSIHRVTPQTTVKHLSVNNLKDVMFRLPEPEHQKKIAQILDTLDTQIQKTEALIAKLEKIKEGLLHDLLTRGIDQSSHLRPMPEQAPELYKESAVGLIPKDWNVSNLGAASISSVIGPFGSDLVASDYRSEGVPVVFVRDIASARYNRASQVFLNQGKAQALSAHEVKAGDLLLTKMGLPPCISAIYPESEQAGIITADIVRLRLKNDVAPEWAHYYVNSEKVKSQVRGITAGVTRPKVTLKDVRGLRIAVPDIEEQARILNILQHSSNGVESEISSLAKLRAQKSGLTDDLLTGRVRVTPLLKDAV